MSCNFRWCHVGCDYSYVCTVVLWNVNSIGNYYWAKTVCSQLFTMSVVYSISNLQCQQFTVPYFTVPVVYNVSSLQYQYFTVSLVYTYTYRPVEMCFMTWSKLQTHFQGITGQYLCFWKTFFAPYISTCPVLFLPVHNRFSLSKWQGLCINLCSWSVSQYVYLAMYHFWHYWMYLLSTAL